MGTVDSRRAHPVMSCAAQACRAPARSRLAPSRLAPSRLAPSRLAPSRLARTVLACTMLACTGLAAACGSATSSPPLAGPSSSAASPAAPAASPTVTASPNASPSVPHSAPASPTGADTFLAPGQDLNATPLHEPACASGCPLSGDSTAILYAMTWTTWSASAAVGSGTYKLDDCSPNCAQGTMYPVAAVVTLSQPVKACSPSGTRWFWSRASFEFPHGLPKALQGPDAPENPWTFSSLATAAGQSCGSAA